MAKILGIGIATVDIINSVTDYPAEDSEIRASSQSIRRGGNVTNTLVVLSQLGHQCNWGGTLADDAQAAFVLNELDNYEIDHSAVSIIKNSTTPTSYITLNEINGSRTIVHYRDLNEFNFDSFKKIDLNQFDWTHFEGRNIEQTKLMMKHLKSRYPDTPVSLECEKHRDGIESLFQYADVLIFSKHYCQQQNIDTPELFLKTVSCENTQKIILTWGDKGAFLKSSTEVRQFCADKIDKIIDSIGAGDTFNAGIIDALCSNNKTDEAIKQANQLAGFKLRQNGFDISSYALNK